MSSFREVRPRAAANSLRQNHPLHSSGDASVSRVLFLTWLTVFALAACASPGARQVPDTDPAPPALPEAEEHSPPAGRRNGQEAARHARNRPGPRTAPPARNRPGPRTASPARDRHGQEAARPFSRRGSHAPSSGFERTLAELTTEQKAGQLIMPWVLGDFAPEGTASARRIGGYVDNLEIGGSDRVGRFANRGRGEAQPLAGAFETAAAGGSRSGDGCRFPPARRGTDARHHRARGRHRLSVTHGDGRGGRQRAGLRNGANHCH